MAAAAELAAVARRDLLGWDWLGALGLGWVRVLDLERGALERGRGRLVVEWGTDWE